MTDETIRHLGDGELYVAPGSYAGPYEEDDGILYAVMPDGTRYPLARIERMREAGEQLRLVIDSVRRGFEEMRPAIVQVAESLRRAGVLAEQPPTDPRARALWLRQHRNTGPAKPGPQHRRRTDQ